MVILPKSVADFVRCEGVFLNHGNISLSQNSLLKRSYHIFLIGHLSDSFTFSAWQCLFMLLILLTCCFLETIDRSPVVRWSPLLSADTPVINQCINQLVFKDELSLPVVLFFVCFLLLLIISCIFAKRRHPGRPLLSASRLRRIYMVCNYNITQTHQEKVKVIS